MDDWNPPHKPAQLCESRLISAILDGTFPINSSLPAERELAARLGVTRPTLREVLTRLDRAGWIEIHHGKPTRVRDYWREGNLMVLAALAQAARQLPPTFRIICWRCAPCLPLLIPEKHWSGIARL